jgi:SAM-dependent methyltransferase
MALPTHDAYGTDLAYIHDAGYGGIACDAARRLTEELARAGCREGTVVDLGCGSGILAHHVLQAGYDVVGVDVSDAMVAMARKRASGARFHVGSFVSTELPRCVAVTAIGEVLNYACDAANDEPARATLFKRVYQALVPGGLWLFDMAGPERATPGHGHRTFAEGADWAVLVETDVATGILTRTITTFRQVGTTYRRRTEVHRLSLVDPTDVLKSLRAAGFEASSIAGYGVTRLPQGVAAFLARKSGDAAA